jgi:hypothetical protein
LLGCVPENGSLGGVVGCGERSEFPEGGVGGEGEVVVSGVSRVPVRPPKDNLQESLRVMERARE